MNNYLMYDKLLKCKLSYTQSVQDKVVWSFPRPIGHVVEPGKVSRRMLISSRYVASQERTRHEAQKEHNRVIVWKFKHTQGKRKKSVAVNKVS